MKITAYKPDLNQEYNNEFKNTYPFSKIGRVVVDKNTGEIISECNEMNSNYIKECKPYEHYDPRITRIIQAQNSKLIEWDKDGNYPIKREGNLPLDSYIVASGDWGTIYSDGAVTVERLATTTFNDYNTALSQLEEIQASEINLLNEEGYTPFDFNSLTDHETLINDINNANVNEINNTEYPIVYTNEETGETIAIEKPVLKEGTIPTPISFGCLVTGDNRIYTGIEYENYRKNVKKYGLENIEPTSNENNISKYKAWGTVKNYRGICYVTNVQNESTTMEEFYESCTLKIRLTYNGSYIKPEIRSSNSNGGPVKIDSIELMDGWYKVSTCHRWKPENQTYRSFTIVASDLFLKPDTVINEGELFIEIDDSSFMYTSGQVELPTVPQGMIVPNCNLEFNVPIDLVQNSIIVKGLQLNPNQASGSWIWESNNNLFALPNLESDIGIYSNAYKNGVLVQNEAYSKNFKISQAVKDELHRELITFQQLLIYKGDLTQKELETERDKNKYELQYLDYDMNNQEIMVRIPAFYCKREWKGEILTDSILNKVPLTKTFKDYEVHPAFVRLDGSIRPYILIGAFLGTEKDGQLRSVPSLELPTVNKTISAFRDLARQGRDIKWNILDITSVSAIQMLYKIGFQNLNSQEQIGIGYCYNKTEASNIGNTLNLGNRSGYLFVNEQISIFGIEDFYGNVLQIIDGMIINDNIYYITNNNNLFGNDYYKFKKIIGEKEPGLRLSGTMKKIEHINNEFSILNIGKEYSHDNFDTYYCDQFKNNNLETFNIPIFGSYYINENLPSYVGGVFAFEVNYSTSWSWGKASSRLTYLP